MIRKRAALGLAPVVIVAALAGSVAFAGTVRVNGTLDTAVPTSTVSAGPERIYLAQADAGPVESPVSYASDQADRGESRYQKDCEECHGDDLKGGLNGGAPIRGLAFERKYFDGAPASWMFEYMSSAMPPNSPGRYSAHTYADLMAYILKRNGVRAGAPLPSDLDALDLLIMQK